MSRHKWVPKWDDEQDQAIMVCNRCGLKKRKRYLYAKGTLVKKAAHEEVFVDGNWIGNSKENTIECTEINICKKITT